MTETERKSMMEHLEIVMTNREKDFYAEEMGQQLFVCLMTDNWSHLNSKMLEAVNERRKEVA